jgi:hypothetical protein
VSYFVWSQPIAIFAIGDIVQDRTHLDGLEQILRIIAARTVASKRNIDIVLDTSAHEHNSLVSDDWLLHAPWIVGHVASNILENRSNTRAKTQVRQRIVHDRRTSMCQQFDIGIGQVNRVRTRGRVVEIAQLAQMRNGALAVLVERHLLLVACFQQMQVAWQIVLVADCRKRSEQLIGALVRASGSGNDRDCVFGIVVLLCSMLENRDHQRLKLRYGFWLIALFRCNGWRVAHGLGGNGGDWRQVRLRCNKTLSVGNGSQWLDWHDTA